MKKVYSAILLLSFVTGIVQPFMPALEYYFFKERIIEHHCINKDNPDMECDGMCYLSKKIHQSQDHDDHIASGTINYYPAAVQYYRQKSLIIFPHLEKHIFRDLVQKHIYVPKSPPVPPPQKNLVLFLSK